MECGRAIWRFASSSRCPPFLGNRGDLRRTTGAALAVDLLLRVLDAPLLMMAFVATKFLVAATPSLRKLSVPQVCQDISDLEAQGLCVAFEKKECSNTSLDFPPCAKLASNFEKITGEPLPQLANVECPCFTTQQISDLIATYPDLPQGGMCEISDSFALITDGFCSVRYLIGAVVTSSDTGYCAFQENGAGLERGDLSVEEAVVCISYAEAFCTQACGGSTASCFYDEMEVNGECL